MTVDTWDSVTSQVSGQTQNRPCLAVIGSGVPGARKICRFPSGAGVYTLVVNCANIEQVKHYECEAAAGSVISESDYAGETYTGVIKSASGRQRRGKASDDLPRYQLTIVIEGSRV